VTREEVADVPAETCAAPVEAADEPEVLAAGFVAAEEVVLPEDEETAAEPAEALVEDPF
jgi:hypothetical protein